MEQQNLVQLTQVLEDLFQGENDPGDQVACINFTEDQWYHYAKGFQRATKHLLKAGIEAQGGDIDLLIYPTLYCFRHYLELTLKHIIYTIHTKFEVTTPPDWKIKQGGHSLSKLWEELRHQFNEHHKMFNWEMGGDFEKIIATLVNKFDEFDSGSFIFRYPNKDFGEIGKNRSINLRIRELSYLSYDKLYAVFSEVEYLLDIFNNSLGSLSDHYEEMRKYQSFN